MGVKGWVRKMFVLCFELLLINIYLIYSEVTLSSSRQLLNLKKQLILYGEIAYLRALLIAISQSYQLL